MTKRKAQKEVNGSELQIHRAIDNAYFNALEENIPASRESSSQNTLYETLDLSSMQTTTESPGQVSKQTTSGSIGLPAAAVRSIRCLQVVCIVLVVIIIAMAATIGSLMSEQVSIGSED